MATTLFLTKEQIFLTRKTKEKRLTDFLTPYEPVLIDVKSLACWQRPLSSLVILVSIVLFFVLVPEQGCFFFLATSLFFGKTLNLSRSYGLWGVNDSKNSQNPMTGTASSQPISSAPQPLPSAASGCPPSPSSPPPILVDVAQLAQRLTPIWLQAEFLYERLLRLRWESRGKFCLVVSTICLIGYFIGDVILPFHFLTVFVCLALTLPALSHHRFHRRLLKRFGPLLVQFDLAMDIKRRPLGGRAAGDKRQMRGSRLLDIDEVSDDLPIPNLNHTDADVVLRHDDDVNNDDDQATDGEDIDLVDEEVDPDELLFNPRTNQRHPSRELLVQSHLELAPEDRLHSESERQISRSMHVPGSRHSAPPNLFTTSRDLQDLGLVPFDEEMETGKGTESGEEATGLTPDWSREASGDEDDDASLMEFLPEGVTRMPSIHSKRSSNNDSLISGDHLLPRQYVQPPRQSRDAQAGQLSLVSAGTQLLASLATAGLRTDPGPPAIADNVNHNQRQAYHQNSGRGVESQIAEALLDDANGNRRGISPLSSASSSDDNSGFEFLDRPNADAYDDQALLEAAMREEGL